MATNLPPRQQLAASGKWPVVGECEPRDDNSPWRLTIEGLVQQTTTWSLLELESREAVDQTIDVHCVTRWSKPAMQFTGISLASLLAEVGVADQARFVSFIARSQRNHSTSLPLDYVNSVGVLLATHAEGKPLSTEHGGPLRAVVPGRYFYKSVKWVERIELLAEDRLGYWESEAGYHNNADPWQEQRYMASHLSRQQMSNVLRSRDFRGLDLRGLQAAGHDLSGLQAEGAILRDADFRGCNLTAANFTGANLSNARFDNANLTTADFLAADCEGASFEGANLHGVDFRAVGSLFGATFDAGLQP